MRTAVIVPCHKRPEYTAKCIKALEDSQAYPHNEIIFYLFDDGSKDGTLEILNHANLPKIVIEHKEPLGLRATIIEFFNEIAGKDFKYIAKMDNDCLVPEQWLNRLEFCLESNKLDVISPNVMPSDAGAKMGKDMGSYYASVAVGGLWFMKKHLINDVDFEAYAIDGIRGAYQLLNQILVEKDPVVGWSKDVVVQDIGHWSGAHPDHIKSEEHAEYSANVGRRISW